MIAARLFFSTTYSCNRPRRFFLENKVVSGQFLCRVSNLDVRFRTFLWQGFKPRCFRWIRLSAFFERNFIASFSFSVRNKLRSLIRWSSGNFIASFSFSVRNKLRSLIRWPFLEISLMKLVAAWKAAVLARALGTPFDSGGVSGPTRDRPQVPGCPAGPYLASTRVRQPLT